MGTNGAVGREEVGDAVTAESQRLGLLEVGRAFCAHQASRKSGCSRRTRTGPTRSAWPSAAFEGADGGRLVNNTMNCKLLGSAHKDIPGAHSASDCFAGMHCSVHRVSNLNTGGRRRRGLLTNAAAAPALTAATAPTRRNVEYPEMTGTVLSGVGYPRRGKACAASSTLSPLSGFCPLERSGRVCTYPWSMQQRRHPWRDCVRCETARAATGEQKRCSGPKAGHGRAGGIGRGMWVIATQTQIICAVRISSETGQGGRVFGPSGSGTRGPRGGGKGGASSLAEHG